MTKNVWHENINCIRPKVIVGVNANKKVGKMRKREEREYFYWSRTGLCMCVFPSLSPLMSHPIQGHLFFLSYFVVFWILRGSQPIGMYIHFCLFWCDGAGKSKRRTRVFCTVSQSVIQSVTFYLDQKLRDALRWFGRTFRVLKKSYCILTVYFWFLFSVLRAPWDSIVGRDGVLWVELAASN